MKKILSLLLAMQLTPYALRANDGVYYTSGSMLMPMSESEIQVKKEILTITIADKENADVDVYYEFYNPTDKPKTVRMGFEALPDYNADWQLHRDGKHPYIYDFVVEMNGEQMKYKNSLASVQDGCKLLTDKELEKWELSEWGSALALKSDQEVTMDFAYVYYFDATFVPGLNRVHHTYSYKMSMTVGTTFEIPYKLSPAGRWAGNKIGDFTLKLCVPHTAKNFLFSCTALDDIKPAIVEGTGKMRKVGEDLASTEFSLRDGVVTWHALNFVPDENELYIYSSDCFTTFSEEAPLGSFYDRTTYMHLDVYESLHESEPDGMTDDFRRAVIRNLPYAHRGRIFKRSDLDKYFRSLWWYMPDPNYTDDTSDFTPSDWHYVREGSNPRN